MASQSRSLSRAISALQRLSDLFVERREQLAAQAGLSVSQWRVLEEVASEHFMPSLFARRRAVSPAAVSKLIRGLLDRDLVQVSISSSDGRQREYALTSHGEETLAQLRANRAGAIAAVWGDLAEEDLLRFSEFGEQLGDRLEAYADQKS